ncbi:unnamed protein product [Mytilus edulis]|uniref:Novel STAND NTPase 3 domain-containing protein n=1 Tax=Mytilus edulis TaxID=6550 RepID=A0A8S3T2J8_MYTED|nr:unnamed protein product [Mytilus edulis]
MDKKERENFYRNTILIVDFTKCAFVELLELHLTGKHLSFEEFLNQNQHDLYHLCYNKARCCQCIRGKRNTTYGHASETKISDEDYNKCRSETEPALLLLAAVCEKEEETKQKLHDLQQRPLDENAKAVLDSMQTKIDSLGQSQTENTQMILSGIREIQEGVTPRKGYYRDLNFLTLAALKVHTEAGTFVETFSAVSAAMTFLKEFGIVVITGPPGAGKSRIAMELLHQFSKQEKRYQVMQLPDISKWQEVIDLNEDCIVLCDDIFGKINCDLDENIHSKLIDMIITYVTNGHVKVIMTIRERVKRIRNCLFTRRRSLLCECIIDLSSKSFQMNDKEKGNVWSIIFIDMELRKHVTLIKKTFQKYRNN